MSYDFHDISLLYNIFNRKNAHAAESKATTQYTHEFQRLSIFLDEFQSETGACGQCQRQQKHNKYDTSSFVTIFHWKKAPAAALRHSRKEVQQTSSNFTGLQRT